MNFIMQLRETAKASTKPEVAQRLRDAADDLDMALCAAFADATTENMQTLNGAWVFAERVLKAAPPLGGDGSQGGAMPVTEEMRRAG